MTAAPHQAATMISIQQQQANLGFQDFTTCSAAARASSAAVTAAVGTAPQGFASHLQQLLLGRQSSAESSGVTDTAVTPSVGSPQDHNQHSTSLSTDSPAAGLSTTSSAAGAAAGAPQDTTVCAASHPSLQQQQQVLCSTRYGLPSTCEQQQGPAGVVSTAASADYDPECLQTPAGGPSRNGSAGSADTAAGMGAGLLQSRLASNQQQQLQLLLAQQQLQLSSHATLQKQQQQQMQLLMLQGQQQQPQWRQLVLKSAVNTAPGAAASKQLVLAPTAPEPFPAPLTSTPALQDPTFSAGLAAGMLQGIAHFAKHMPSAATGLPPAPLPPACPGPSAAARTGAGVQKVQLQAELQARQQQFRLQKSLRGQLQQQVQHLKGVTKKVGGGSSSSRSIHACVEGNGMPPPHQRKRCLEACTAGGATHTSSQAAAGAAAAAVHSSSCAPVSADTAVSPAAAAPAGGFNAPASSVAVCCSISDLLGTSATEEAAVRLASMSREELFQFAAKAVGGCCTREQLNGAERCVNEGCRAAALAAGVSCCSGPSSIGCGPTAACCTPVFVPGSSSGSGSKTPGTACTAQGGSCTGIQSASGAGCCGAQADTPAAQLAAAGGLDSAAQPGTRQQLGPAGRAPAASILPAGSIAAQRVPGCCQPVKGSAAAAGGGAGAVQATTGGAAVAGRVPAASASLCNSLPVSAGPMGGGGSAAPAICTPEQMGGGCCSVDDIVAGRCILTDAPQPPPPQQQQPSSATVPCCTSEQMLAGCCSAVDIVAGRCILTDAPQPPPPLQQQQPQPSNATVPCCTPEQMLAGCCSAADIAAGRCILTDAPQPPPQQQQQQQPSSAQVPCCTPEQMLAGCCSAADIVAGRCSLKDFSSALLTNPPAAAGCCSPSQICCQPGSMLAPPDSGNLLPCQDNHGTAFAMSGPRCCYCTPDQLEAGCCSPEQVVSGSCILVQTEELAEQLSAMLRCSSDPTAAAATSGPLSAAPAVPMGRVPQSLRAVGVVEEAAAAGAGAHSYKELYMEWQREDGEDGMDWAAQGLFAAA